MTNETFVDSPKLIKPLQQRRAGALDALRGFAILTMILSGVIPYGVLLSWMYHAQVPPPDHKFIPIPGITWVDLVFPFFLFAMGAAIPLALARRIEKGASKLQVIGYIIKRGFILTAFAILSQHIRPWTMSSDPTSKINLLAILGFVLLFGILMRFPKSFNPYLCWSIRIAGWLGFIIFMALIRYPDGSGFSLNRSDIIIVLLTNSAIFGSIIWLFTQKSILLRLSSLGILMAFRLSSPLAGWIHNVWEYSPLPWILRWGYVQYLFIIIPGSIVGDMLLNWMKNPEISKIRDCHVDNIPLNDTSKANSWLSLRYVSIAILMIAINVVLVVGLKGRWILETSLISFIMCGLGFWLLSNPRNDTEKLFCKLFLWGVYWLILGLIFEPYENGIKKDPPTMSYYFVTSGLAIFLIIAFSIIIDVFKKRWLQLLIDNGQNPMIAYVGNSNVILPIFALIGLDRLIESITPIPWLGAVRGAFYTFLLALMVSFFTRRKIFWRS